MDEMTLQVEANQNAPRFSRSQLVPMRAKLEPRYDDVLLMVSELVSNSVQHGGTNDIDIKVTAGSDRIRVEVSDGGPGFSIDDHHGDGLGLAIVEEIADRWGIEDGIGFTIWAELSTNPVV